VLIGAVALLGLPVAIAIRSHHRPHQKP
jgi:hypothetical protein